jgi:hypothetical protein
MVISIPKGAFFGNKKPGLDAWTRQTQKENLTYPAFTEISIAALFHGNPVDYI